MTDWGTIAIGTRMNDRCDPRFFNSWSHLIAGGLRRGDTVLDAAIELPQHFAGTALALFYLRSDADTLCMVDTDMIFQPDALERLRSDPAGYEYDILSALSVTRRKPFYPIVLRLKEENGETKYQCAKDEINGGIVEVDAVGTGFTLIRRSVFERMEKELSFGRWFFEFGHGGLGEDTQFCQRAKSLKASCKIGVHTGVSIGHRGPIAFYWNVKEKKTEMESYDQCAELFAAANKKGN